jgi:hypothetical protein
VASPARLQASSEQGATDYIDADPRDTGVILPRASRTSPAR